MIQQARLDAEIKHMTIDDALFHQLLDTANKMLTKESTDTPAIAAKDALITTLQAQLAPNPALAASASAFLANALLANPPAKPVVVYDPTATYAPGAVVTDSTGAIWTAVTPVVGRSTRRYGGQLDADDASTGCCCTCTSSRSSFLTREIFPVRRKSARSSLVQRPSVSLPWQNRQAMSVVTPGLSGYYFAFNRLWILAGSPEAAEKMKECPDRPVVNSRALP